MRIASIITPRVSMELISWLRKNYPARCIESDQDPIQAHRYAAQHELAQRIIRMGTGNPDHDIPEEDLD